LRDKNQTDQQQQRASHAVSIYYEIKATHSGKEIPSKTKNEKLSTKKEDLSIGVVPSYLIDIYSLLF